MKMSEVVKMYMDLRAEKVALDNAKKEVQKKMDKIETVLLRKFQETGLDSIKTEYGTAYSTTRTSASLADREAFMEFVKANGEWALLEARAAKSAVEQFKEMHDGELPPGVNWSEETVVNFRQ